MELASATDTLSNLVVATVDEEEGTLLGTQYAGTTTIEMADDPEGENDGVLG
jgi:hypothetical protein